MLFAVLFRGEYNAVTQRDVLTELEMGNPAESISGPATYKKTERPRANSSGSGDQSRMMGGPVGGSIALGGKFIFQNPAGQQCKPWLMQSPGNVHRQ